MAESCDAVWCVGSAKVIKPGSAPSPQPSPGGRGGRSEWVGNAALAGRFVGRITVRGYTPLAVPPERSAVPVNPIADKVRSYARASWNYRKAAPRRSS